MILSSLFLCMIASEKPVVRLDEVVIEGHIRKPNLIEIKGSHLDEMVQKAALQNLIKLEGRLLKPSSRLKNLPLE